MSEYNLEFLKPEFAATDFPLVTKREEGELAVDVYETEQAIYVRAAIAGVSPEEIKLTLAADLLTIKGQRQSLILEKSARALCQECHWGAFSRTILLPAPVEATQASAVFLNGILSIQLPKKPEEIQPRTLSLKKGNPHQVL